MLQKNNLKSKPNNNIYANNSSILKETGRVRLTSFLSPVITAKIPKMSKKMKKVIMPLREISEKYMDKDIYRTSDLDQSQIFFIKSKLKKNSLLWLHQINCSKSKCLK